MDNNSLKRANPVQALASMASGRSGASRRRSFGFTLVELMVVVVIIGILIRIAYPSYMKSVRSSNRGAAKSALVDLAAREEKFLSINNTYSSMITDLYPGTTMAWSISVPFSGTATYTIAAPTIAAATATAPPTFTITAVPTGSQVGDTCGNFIINSIGQQTVSGTGSCW